MNIIGTFNWIFDVELLAIWESTGSLESTAVGTPMVGIILSNVLRPPTK